MPFYEVFRQEKEGDPMVHSGNVEAPDTELAIHYAREFYGRRQESERLWIVARREIYELQDHDLLKPPLPRDFKKPEGYVLTEKLRRIRDKAAREGRQGGER
jgi:phenylacetate-CoA oxygenase PaaH subunit